MFKNQMKPETIERRKREHKIESQRRSTDLTKRLIEAAREDPEGPDSIWAEMLAERLAGQP